MSCVRARVSHKRFFIYFCGCFHQSNQKTELKPESERRQNERRRSRLIANEITKKSTQNLVAVVPTEQCDKSTRSAITSTHHRFTRIVSIFSAIVRQQNTGLSLILYYIYINISGLHFSLYHFRRFSTVFGLQATVLRFRPIT